MTQVVSKFSIVCIGTTRDECIDALDRLGLTILESVGGAPWQVPDDDIKKVPANSIVPPIGDSEGFCYLGVRSYDFRGPVVLIADAPYHDGFKVQTANE